MKHLLTIFLVLSFAAVFFAQKPTKKTSIPSQVPISASLDENQEFQNARSQSSLTDRIAALQKFTVDFPKSGSKTFALELIVSTRAALGEQKLRLSDNQAGIDLFKIAVAEAPVPVSDKFFNEVLGQLPTNLYYRNQREAAYMIAKMIEEKIAGNANQLLSLAAFYLGTENGSDGKRLADKVIELEPDSASAYQTLGFANRLNFDLEAAAAAYTKALELKPDSIVSKRNLAEMNRATGKAEEAIALFREILETNPDDAAAENGLILSLFDSDNRTEAETAMKLALEANPNNFFLLSGAAYWYAAHQESAKAIELADKAIKIEPRFSWAYIALGRGLIQQKRPLEAERMLMIGRQYGNFPTLNYELASARMAAGLFREAADELKKSFEEKDGVISVNLGGRILKQGKSFIEILAFERRASIFESVAADDPVSAGKLKSLLKFSQKIEAKEINETQLTDAADEFISGDDLMKTHRSLFVANRLLENKIAIPKALELTEAALGNIDPSLNVASPEAAIMADALYETRTIAALRNEILVVPEVSRQTLTRILRGRIEELAGWALLQEQKPEEAVSRFNRAISSFPVKSAWWRSAKWRLGDALGLTGNSKDALKAYIDGYDVDAPNLAKRILIESLYARVNGSTEGLDRIIGQKTVPTGSPTAQTDKSEETASLDTVDESPATKNPDEIITTETEALTTAKESSDKITNAESASKELKFPENVPVATSTPIKAAIIPATSVTKSAEPDKLPELKIIERTEQTVNPIFESIIINVPKNDKEVKKNTGDPTLVTPIEADKTEVKQPIKDEQVPSNMEEQVKIEPENTEPKESAITEPEGKLDAKETETPPQGESNEPGRLITIRPRIAGAAKADTNEVVLQCTLKIGQENIQLLNDGGSLGMFVGFEGIGGDATKIRASSGSPLDIDVELQPDISVLSERAFYIIKSISTKTGAFKVTFDSNCGKNDVTVTVR